MALKQEKSTGLSSSGPLLYIYDEDDWPWDLTKCPRRFSGAKGEDVLDFIDDLELFITVKRIPLETALLQLGRMFIDPATIWWENMDDSIKTWEQAKTKLSKRFGCGGGHSIPLHRLVSQLRQRRQQPDEKAIDYVISISSIMRKMKPPLDDSLQVGFIISGLRPAIARHMIGKDKLNPLQLTSEIIQIEESLKRISNKK